MDALKHASPMSFRESEAQRELVTASLRNTVVVAAAGAGAGKTTTCAARVQRAVRDGICQADCVCVVTFTNVAAAEMRAAIDAHAPTTPSIIDVRVGTLHSVAAAICYEAGVECTRDTCIRVATEVTRRGSPLPWLLEHIVVDEVQDNDMEQYDLIEAMLLQSRGSECGLTLVGDGRQAIYGFRGGWAEGFARAPDRFRALGYAVHERALPENYRSTSNIVAVGNALFARDERHAPMRAVRPAGLKPTLTAYASHNDEIGAVAQRVQHSVKRGRVAGDHLILCRTNHMVVIMTLELEALGVSASPCDEKSVRGSESSVRVSTVHGEKGAEARYVYALGLSDATYPGAETIPPEGNPEQNQRSAMASARATLNVTVTRAKDELHCSWALADGPLTRLLDRDTLHSLWAVTILAPDCAAVSAAPTTAVRTRGAGTIRLVDLATNAGGGTARLALMGATMRTHSLPVECDEAPRDDTELLAWRALGRDDMLCAVRGVLQDPRGPLHRDAAGKVLARLQQAAARAETTDLLRLARLCMWVRGKVHASALQGSESSPMDLAQTTRTIDAMTAAVCELVGRPTEASVARRVALRRADTTRRSGHVTFHAASHWVECERGEDAWLLTIIDARQDAATELTIGALLLACRFLASSRNAHREDTTAYVLSVAAWNPAGAELHTMQVGLGDAVAALQQAYSGVLRGACLRDDELAGAVGLCAV